MSRDEDKSERTQRLDAAEIVAGEARSEASAAKSMAARALPRRSALTLSAITGLISAAVAVAGGGYWLSQLAASKADAAEVAAIKRENGDEKTRRAVLEALLGELKDDVKEIKRMVRRQLEQPDKERRAR